MRVNDVTSVRGASRGDSFQERLMKAGKGSWIVVLDGQVSEIFADREGSVECVKHASEVTGGNVNAQIFPAAWAVAVPELLRALKAMVRYADKEKLVGICIRDARVAIAKAEGF